MNRFNVGDVVETYDGVTWKIDYLFKNSDKYYATIVAMPNKVSAKMTQEFQKKGYKKGEKDQIEDINITGKSKEPAVQEFSVGDKVKTRDGTSWQINYGFKEPGKYYATVLATGNTKNKVKVGSQDIIRAEDIDEKIEDKSTEAPQEPPKVSSGTKNKNVEPAPSDLDERIRKIVQDEISKAFAMD